MLFPPGLRRFWFDFEPSDEIVSLYGCGVTAIDLDDALQLIQRTLLDGRPLPPVRRVIEDVDVSTLDEGHVIPTMEAPVWRGVWFPGGGRRP